jgi:hypothetical protein
MERKMGNTTTKKRLDAFKSANPEIFKYRRRRLIKLFIKILLFDLIFVVFAIKGCEIDPVKSITFSLLCAIILPTVIFEPHKYLKRSYLGEITGMKHVMRRIFPKGILYPGALMNSRVVPFIIYSVTDEKGNKHKLEIRQDYEKVYKMGDSVLVILGLDYPVCYTKRKYTVCLKCGGLFVPNGEFCEARFCDARLPVIPEDPDSEFDYFYENT